MRSAGSAPPPSCRRSSPISSAPAARRNPTAGATPSTSCRCSRGRSPASPNAGAGDARPAPAGRTTPRWHGDCWRTIPGRSSARSTRRSRPGLQATTSAAPSPMPPRCGSPASAPPTSIPTGRRRTTCSPTANAVHQGLKRIDGADRDATQRGAARRSTTAPWRSISSASSTCRRRERPTPARTMRCRGRPTICARPCSTPWTATGRSTAAPASSRATSLSATTRRA